MAEPKWEMVDYAPMIARLNEVAAELAQIAASAVADCPCAACDPGMLLDGERLPFASRMNVCPECGNKRCPKAANHATWQCSGSNAVGQVGVRAEDAQIAAPVPAVGADSGSGDSRTSETLGDRLRALVAGTDPDEGAYESVDVGALLGMADEVDRLESERNGARIKTDQWKARYVQTREECRHLHQEGLSRHDWHAKHCGAVEAADRMRAQLDQANTARGFAQRAAGREHKRAEAAEAVIERVEALAEYEHAHGDAITRCNLVAQRIRDAIDGPKREPEEAREHTPHRPDEMCTTMPCPEAVHPLGKVIGVIRERGTEHYKTNDTEGA